MAVERSTSGANPVVAGVAYDSRRVRAGSLFVAMRGGTVDGNRFIDAALDAGAAAIVTDSSGAYERLHAKGLPAALVEHGRHALSEAATVLYDAPQGKLKTTAITGTNGKTTTAYLLAQLLESAGRSVLLIGTVETRIAGTRRESTHTTPEASDLLALMREAVDAGCTECVMEASSHALEQGRMWGVPVDVAVFTNLTQDHLDYHGSMAAYFRAKARLFTAAGTGVRPRVAVVNGDAEYAGNMMLVYEGVQPLVRYAIEDDDDVEHRAGFQARDVHATASGTTFTFVTPKGEAVIESPLVGGINVENLLAAMCAALARGLSLHEIARAVPRLGGAPGRFELVQASRLHGFLVVVDYAHTPDALENLLRIARTQADLSGSRIVTMFGCGGDRDRAKRPLMGQAAMKGSDFVIVTSDNPRSEQPQEIADEIVAGMGAGGVPYVVEPDRRRAIALAIAEAKAGDVVLLAGKGHEKTQTFAERIEPFDDVVEAERVLRAVTGNADSSASLRNDSKTCKAGGDDEAGDEAAGEEIA